MKKLFKHLSKGLCLLLAVIMSVAVVGCGGNDTDNGGNNGVTDARDDLIYFGTHDYTAPEIEDKWLVQNGTTEYQLVVPETTSEADKTTLVTAREEFLKFFQRATGITLEVKVDTTLPIQEHRPDQHYISFDETTLFNSLKGTDKEITYTYDELTLQGGKIVTVDNNIYFIGYTDRGTLNNVYTFLKIMFNWECYSANTVVHDENVKNLKMRNFAVVDVPDVEYQPTSGYEKSYWQYSSDYGYGFDHPTEGGYYYGTRMRAYMASYLQVTSVFEGKAEDLSYEDYIQLNRPGGHNSVAVMNYEKYKNIYPDWFASGGIQLCYTAHGNPESYELMVSYLAEMIKKALMERPRAEYPHHRSVDITISDTEKMCECEACIRESKIYKHSGLVVKFMNEVAKRVEEWMNLPQNEPYRREDLEIRHYAYLATEAAPAKLNETTGEWEAIDETVMMHKYTCIKYANINADYQQSLFCEDNKWVLDNFDAWVAVANGNIGYFMYNYNVSYHNYFYDGFDHYNTKAMNHYLAGGRSYYYSENIHGNVPTEFGALISYVNAKLCYDSTLDSGELIQNWFDAVYGNASGLMMEMFRMIRLFNHNELVRTDMYKRFSVFNPVHDRFDWKAEVIFSWINKADEALESISYLKETDPEEYDRIRYNIELEVVSPMFICYHQSKIILSEEQDSAFKNRIYQNSLRYPEYQYADFGRQTIKEWLEENL